MNDPVMELGRRCYEAYVKNMKSVAASLGSEYRPHTWDEMPGDEKQGWVCAAEAAGENYPTPFVMECRIKRPNQSHLGSSPLKTLRFQEDDQSIDEACQELAKALKDMRDGKW